MPSDIYDELFEVFGNALPGRGFLRHVLQDRRLEERTAELVAMAAETIFSAPWASASWRVQFDLLDGRPVDQRPLHDGAV